MVTPEPRVPRTWTSVWKTQTSATMASVETSREALSASAGPATPGPSAITSSTSVSPTHAWSVLFLIHLFLFWYFQHAHFPPVQHGNCTNLVNNYRCDCLLGFDGEQQQQQPNGILYPHTHADSGFVFWRLAQTNNSFHNPQNSRCINHNNVSS